MRSIFYLILVAGCGQVMPPASRVPNGEEKPELNPYSEPEKTDNAAVGMPAYPAGYNPDAGFVTEDPSVCRQDGTCMRDGDVCWRGACLNGGGPNKRCAHYGQNGFEVWCAPGLVCNDDVCYICGGLNQLPCQGPAPDYSVVCNSDLLYASPEKALCLECGAIGNACCYKGTKHGCLPGNGCTIEPGTQRHYCRDNTQ